MKKSVDVFVISDHTETDFVTFDPDVGRVLLMEQSIEDVTSNAMYAHEHSLFEFEDIGNDDTNTIQYYETIEDAEFNIENDLKHLRAEPLKILRISIEIKSSVIDIYEPKSQIERNMFLMQSFEDEFMTMTADKSVDYSTDRNGTCTGYYSPVIQAAFLYWKKQNGDK